MYENKKQKYFASLFLTEHYFIKIRREGVPQAGAMLDAKEWKCASLKLFFSIFIFTQNYKAWPFI